MANIEPQLPSAASDEPIYDTSLDSFEMIWAKYKAAIIGGAVAIVVVLVAVFGWLSWSHSARVAAANEFATAKTAEELRAVIDKHGGSVVAGNAALLLAKMQRDEKKLDEANATLREFRDAQPEHPLAPLAGIALAENAALAGNSDDAVKELQTVADANAKSFAAAPALLFKAELLLATGDRNEALRTFQKLESQYATSVAAQSAEPVYRSLEAIARPAAVAAPSADASE